MITNRAFQGSTVTLGTVPYLSGSVIVGSENPIEPFGPVLTGWAPIGGAILSLDRLHPLSEALPTVMQVDIPENATGEVGFLNYGWWGMVRISRILSRRLGIGSRIGSG
jgi:alpha-N-arabinofuranosidase